MNVDRAMLKTFELAIINSKFWKESPCPQMSFGHIHSMVDRWSPDMSEDKKNRWLGWMQATVVAMTYPHSSLDDMKEINRECSND